jgi:hypothetical protein
MKVYFIMLFEHHYFTRTCRGYVCHCGTNETILFTDKEQAQFSANKFEGNGIIAEVREKLW